MPDDKRIEELRRRIRLDPASVAFAGLAEEYRKAGRFEEAVAACRAGLRHHPAYVSARVTLGRSLLALGRCEDARTELEHVIRVAPENLAAIRALAEIHDRLGEVAAASLAAQKATAPASNPATARLESFLESIHRARNALAGRSLSER